ncbi:WD repeat-containing protein slp1 [Coprinopsis marcescibilis]|uniref:WD repeat-containing protein slp1 n=1 Tax=Coprinopsis marcescibilis TaxID=230819 RepID=A0A5C3KKW8_COPMA|nr:WD repeat-containing protein slp1 [Coprinopsis marcescibilis]
MPTLNPKTPSRHRTRSEVSLGAKTPITPSLVSAMGNMNMAGTSGSPVKRSSRAVSLKKGTTTGSGLYDTTNPFIAPPATLKSRPSSPVKRGTTDSLQKQAGSGVIRKGGAESRIDVVQMDGGRMQELKRSKSTPAVNRMGTDQRDRFITSRDPHMSDVAAVAATLEQMSLGSQNSSPGHTARLAAATGVGINRRVLAYHEAPPAASSSSLATADTALLQQREFAKPLYAQRPGALAGSTGATTNKTRKIGTVPEKVLDAPGMLDDFYLNLLSWSSQNCMAVALESATYIWQADTGVVQQLGEAPEGTHVSSVEFSVDGNFLAIGLGNGSVEVWDVEAGRKVRTMEGHSAQVPSLSWNNFIVSSGCGDGSIFHHDVRIAEHKVMELVGHTGEVCGLKWRADGELLASGGNDNVVNIWDGRVGDVGENARGSAKWTKRNHTAAVKGLAWCPWQPSLLATGGGTNDGTIHIWNSTTGARLHSVRTPAQVTSLHWARDRKEIMSTHGFPTNSIMLHAYPSMERVAEIRDAHDSRVLFSCVGPAGDVVCTGGGDENLKLWRIWDLQKERVTSLKKPAKKDLAAVEDLGGGRINPTKSGILSIR